MGKATNLSERIAIIELAEAGLTNRQIVQQLGQTMAVVKKWRHRGRTGLKSKMGRPGQGSLSSFRPEIKETIDRWRAAHPKWGEKTLQAELKRHPAFDNQPIPSASAIGRYLKEQGLTQPYEPHSDLSQTRYQRAEDVHQVWQMDAQGYQPIAGVGRVYLINLNDVYSHLRLLSYPCLVGTERVERHPDTEDYQIALRLAFSDWGLPHHLQVDHESIFYDNRSKSPFPTRLHLWLVALGIGLTYSRVCRPTDQGLTERSHQLWTDQVIEGQTFNDWDHLYLALQQRRIFLNEHLPCRSLNNQPPLSAYPQARYSQKPYRPEQEFALLDLQRVFDYLAQGRWFRLVSRSGTFSLGGQVYFISTKLAHQQIEITFDPDRLHLVCRSADQHIFSRLPLQGISKESLIGSFALQFNLPFFQLALPFDFSTFRWLRLCAVLPVTT
jgi:transposase